MRRVGIVIAALGALVALAAPVVASAAPKTVIGCQDFKRYGPYQYLWPKVAPGTCTMIFRNHFSTPIPKSGAGKISGTTWKNWGKGTATGKGWLQLGVPGAKNMRATMKAYDKRALPPNFEDTGDGACLQALPYYSKIAVTSEGRTWTFIGMPTRQC